MSGTRSMWRYFVCSRARPLTRIIRIARKWEFYHVISGKGAIWHEDGTTAIETGDAFLFNPGEPHQITNDHAQDLILYVVADNSLASQAIFPTVRNGWCAHSSAGLFVPMRWTITMAKSETAAARLNWKQPAAGFTFLAVHPVEQISFVRST